MKPRIEPPPGDWKPIAGFPSYLISRDGQVWSYRRNRLLARQNSRHGILRVNLMENKNPSTLHVARLVAQTFRDDWKPSMRIGYKDNDRTNCSADNLVFTTVSQIALTHYSK